MATCQGRAATTVSFTCRPLHLRRPNWNAGRADESGGSAALDSLARTFDPVFACGGQFLLPGLSVYAAAIAGAALAAGRSELAALAAKQMAGGGAAGTIPVGL